MYETETVTVDQAIAHGVNMRGWPSFGILILTIALAACLKYLFLLPGVIIGAGFIVGLFLMWLYWNFMVTRWRLWAFEHVRNVHELKKRALKANLIGEDGGFSEGMEIRSKAQKEKWELLKQKFNQADVFQDDYAVTDETLIRFSKSKTLFEVILYLGLLGLGIYFVIHHSYLLGGALCALGAWFAFKEYQAMNNPNPQIILSSKGIQTAATPFYSWADISNEDALDESSAKTTRQYLVYDHPSGSERVNIEDLDIDIAELGLLLRVYRGRYNNK
jgi:hypothetical protein